MYTILFFITFLFSLIGRKMIHCVILKFIGITLDFEIYMNNSG